MHAVVTAAARSPVGPEAPAITVTRAPSAAAPRTSTRTAPRSPAACGGVNIGNLAVSRSRRVPDTRALIRDAAGKIRWSRNGSGSAAAVAVPGADRLGEPVELATAPPGSLDPVAIVPTDRGLAECVVVLDRARRAGRAVRGDVDLFGDVQLPPQVIGEQTGQAGAHRRTDDQDCIVRDGRRSSRSTSTRTSSMSADIDTTADAGGEVLRGQLRMGMGMAQADHIGDGQICSIGDGCQHPAAMSTPPDRKRLHGCRRVEQVAIRRGGR